MSMLVGLRERFRASPQQSMVRNMSVLALSATLMLLGLRLPDPWSYFAFAASALALVFADPLTNVLALLVILQLHTLEPLPSIGRINLRVEDIVIAATLTQAALRAIRERARLRTPSLIAALAMLGLWMAVSAAVSPWNLTEKLSMAISIAKWGEFALAAVAGVYLVGQPGLASVLGAWSLCAGLQAILAFARLLPYQLTGFDWLDNSSFLGPFGSAYQFLSITTPWTRRLTGTFGDPAAFGHFQVLAVAAILAQTARPITFRTRKTMYLMLPVLAALGSLTRTSIAALMLVVLAYLLLHRHAANRGNERAILITIFVVSSAVLLLARPVGTVTPAVVRITAPTPEVASPTLVSVTAEPAAGSSLPSSTPTPSVVPSVAVPKVEIELPRLDPEESVGKRAEQATAGIKTALAHPLTGVGWSGLRFTGAAALGSWGGDVYTRLAAELGLPGLLLYGMLLRTAIATAMKMFDDRVEQGVTARWVCLGLLGMMVIGVGDLTLSPGAHVTYWQLLLLAMAGFLQRNAVRRNGQ